MSKKQTKATGLPGDCPAPSEPCPTECPRISTCIFACARRFAASNSCILSASCTGKNDCDKFEQIIIQP